MSGTSEVRPAGPSNRSATNPYRNPALFIELGPWVCRGLMTQEDWREILDIQFAQMKAVRDARGGPSDA